MKRMFPLSSKISQQFACCRLLSRVGLTALLLTALAVLAGCSANKVALNPGDYVEVDNPFSGGAPDESPKIWVLRSSLERGIPRGGDLVKKGYDAVAGKSGGGSAPVGSLPAGTTPHPRVLVIEEKGPHFGVR